ncbi:YiiX/YebB-like N1pC/P60 family cysteine hydrolase [Brevibacillus sp. SAFN-007a]|uniref:YiiX/YebB-like N1pC/P60 family cysteine hydrolase n=1 Tax=Brevibacillus sp. SAFN-007a TaxID=3436862 RepID=UPI003F80965D
MKKFFSTTLGILSALTLIFSGNASAVKKTDIVTPMATDDPTYPGTNIKIKIGDILISDKNSSPSFTGHAAIVTDTETVAEILGYGYHPQLNSLKKFFNERTGGDRGVRIVRYYSSADARDAAEWAEAYVDDFEHVDYEIDDLYDYETSTYCSKLVWNAFYYGADVELKTSRLTIGGSRFLVSLPYDLDDSDGVRIVAEVGDF